MRGAYEGQGRDGHVRVPLFAVCPDPYARMDWRRCRSREEPREARERFHRFAGCRGRHIFRRGVQRRQASSRCFVRRPNTVAAVGCVCGRGLAASQLGWAELGGVLSEQMPWVDFGQAIAGFSEIFRPKISSIPQMADRGDRTDSLVTGTGAFALTTPSRGFADFN